MKKKIRKRRCKHCDDLFKPDSRNLKKQKFCRKSEFNKEDRFLNPFRWKVLDETGLKSAIRLENDTNAVSFLRFNF